MEPSMFVRTFGDYPLIRVLDFLIEGRYFDYTLTEIAEGANVNWATLQKIWVLFEKNKLVVQTRTIGRGRLFRLNKGNLVVKKLIELDITISEQATKDILLTETASARNV